MRADDDDVARAAEREGPAREVGLPLVVDDVADLAPLVAAGVVLVDPDLAGAVARIRLPAPVWNPNRFKIPST